MSNSEMFVTKQGHENRETEISKRLRPEFVDECHQEEANRGHDDVGESGIPLKDEVVVLHHGGGEEEEEEEDGFKTPTSLEHKIPVEIECPPAPRKPKPSRKRKASSPLSNRARVVRLLELSFTGG